MPPVDVASLDRPRTLGRFTANEAGIGTHTLVAHDVRIILDNGTTGSADNVTDFRAVTEEAPPSVRYGIEIGVNDTAPSEQSAQ